MAGLSLWRHVVCVSGADIPGSSVLHHVLCQALQHLAAQEEDAVNEQYLDEQSPRRAAMFVIAVMTGAGIPPYDHTTHTLVINPPVRPC